MICSHTEGGRQLFCASKLEHCCSLVKHTNATQPQTFFHGVDLDMDWVIQANRVSADILRPTITIFLDLPADKAMERIRQGRFHAELFEKEERLRLVREKYFEAFSLLKNEETVVIIDADAESDVVAQRVWDAVSPLLSTL